MGCFQSKKDSGDIHPNVFRVVNIDDGGADLWSGQLEVTENDLVLYREGRDATTWPLRCLRRYGFDGEIFSFESGRRCITGEGIYAFRCRRAGMLFRALQQNIQLRNVISDSLPFQLPNNLLTNSPPSLPRQTLQASVVHRSSIDNGQPETRPNGPSTISNNLTLQTSQTQVLPTVAQSPRSPSSTDILEVMPLYPRPQNGTTHVTNLYQMRDFKREHNNNQPETTSDVRHVYSNDFNRDLAVLRNTLRQEAALNTIKDIEDESRFLRNRYMNENIPMNNMNAPLSPTLSHMSEHYAQLSIEQQESVRLYMNIVPAEGAMDIMLDVPTTPLTPKQADYSNFNVNSYANLAMMDVMDNGNNVKLINYNAKEHTQKYSESDTYNSTSPVEELEVNYAVLDIETNKETSRARDVTSPESQSYASSKNESTTSQCSSLARGRLVSQGSTEKAVPGSICAPTAGVGYTTIDFDKTVALTSVASGTDVDNEGSRKTRHNSVNVVCTSPGVDKGRGN